MSDFIETHRRLAIHLGIPSEPLHSVIAIQALTRIKELENIVKQKKEYIADLTEQIDDFIDRG